MNYLKLQKSRTQHLLWLTILFLNLAIFLAIFADNASAQGTIYGFQRNENTNFQYYDISTNWLDTTNPPLIHTDGFVYAFRGNSNNFLLHNILATKIDDIVTFNITVTNSGPSDATGVSVEDVVLAGFISKTNISNNSTLSVITITWIGLSINNGDTLELFCLKE